MKSLIAMTLGLLSLPIAASAAPLRSQSGPYEVQVLVGGAPAQTFYHAGENYVLGQDNERYTLRVLNHSGRRVEAVISVDGRDAIDGKTADYRNKRGYLVPAYGQVEIEGWRLSRGQAAAFRFSSVADSYAGRTGSAREVGVIGVAIFPERYYAPPPPPVYSPVPRPYHWREYDDYRGDYGSSERSEKDAAAKSRAGAGASEEQAARPPATASPPPSSAPADKRAGASAEPRGDVMAQRDWERRNNRPGLGTAFGERIDAPIQEVPFQRQNTSWPTATMGVRYNDYSGLLAMGVRMDGGEYPYDDTRLRRTADPFPVNDRRYATPPPGWDYRY